MSGKGVVWSNTRIYTPHGVVEGGSLWVNGEGRVEAVGGRELPVEGAEVRNLRGLSVLPGFIDVHIHGGNGYSAMMGTYESLDEISKFHARHGTTSFLATTETESRDRIIKALRNAAETMKAGVSGAELLGIHLEGPFLNVKRRGAQNKKDIRRPTTEEIGEFLEASQHQIKLVTLAPEVEGGMAAVKQFIDNGVTVSVGHSDATFEDMGDAIRYGASHTTHHFNGMSPLHHREPGVAGAGLMMPQLTTELIADGIHVHPAVVKHLFECKTPWNVCMITDAIGCAGLPDGVYGQVVMTNGQIYLKDGSSLAGSSLTTIQALRNVVRFTGYPIEKILPSLTQVPARQIGMSGRKGTLEAGKDADFLIVDDALNLYATYVKGREVYSGEEYYADSF